MSVTYRDAGVNLDAAEGVTDQITQRLGSRLFGGFLPVSELKAYESPVLVSSIDGIGTKVRLAARLNRVEGLGQDIVHHCVNDIAVHGATPLFFLDYLAFHHLEPSLVERIVDGISGACEALGVRLAGGETAEMPSVYPPGHFDIAGAIVGVVEEQEIVDGSAILPRDVLIGLPSSGLHTNGYSLVQRIFSEEDYLRRDPIFSEEGYLRRDSLSCRTLGEALLEPHRCYLPEIRSLIATGTVHGLAHITGGGIPGNLFRVLPSGVQAVIDLPPPPPLFRCLEEGGSGTGAAKRVARDEMRRVFNMGVGLIAVCDASARCLIDGKQFFYLGEIRASTNHERSVYFRDDARD